MSSQGISTRESPPTTPVIIILQNTPADEFLLSRMETLVALAVVLAGKGFATDAANEWTLIGVSAQM
jgi:hypothetical protein